MCDLLFHNGHILTFDSANPAPEAVAVEAGKIKAVGRLADLRALAHPNTQWVDLEGKTLMPGFFDAHIHVWKVGDLLTFNLDLRGVGSIEEMQDKLRDFAAQHPELKWVRARGFNEAQMREGRLPTRHDIDKVVADRPVFLQRTCAHIAVINFKALEICGITAKTPVPFGGEIRLGNDGLPNGILCETALGLAMRHFPPTTKADYETMILAACNELLHHGVTSACDPAVMPDLLEVYHEMDKAGRLPMRIHAVPIVLPEGGTEPLPLPELYESENLVVNTVKFFADGGLSGQTAALSRPYKNANSKGILRLDPNQFFQLALEAQSKGFQVATHAIGDEAISLVVNTYERLYQAQPDAPCHRIEHLGLPDREHLRRIADMGLHVVTQPIFLRELGRNFRQSLDDDFLKNCYPFRSMLDHGINVAFSTDAPVVKDVRPLSCIAAAMDRMDMDGEVISPEEKIGLMEALECYTVGSMKANRAERLVGSIELGKQADILSLPIGLFTDFDAESYEIDGVWEAGKKVVV